MSKYDETQIDTLVHEMLGLLGTEDLLKLSPDSWERIGQHARSCSACEPRYNEYLDAYWQSLPPEKQARMTAIGRALATEIREEVEAQRYLNEAVVNATRHGRPELIIEAQERIRERQELMKRYQAALRDEDNDEAERVIQQLRELPLGPLLKT